MHFPYDPRNVEAAIYRAETGLRSPETQKELVPREIAAAAQRARGRAMRFRLFTAEFAALSQKERDTQIRSRIRSAITSANFTSAQSVGELHRKLEGILARGGTGGAAAEYLPDLARIRRRLVQGFKANALEDIPYEFDAVTFHRIRAAPKQGLGILRNVMAPLVKLAADEGAAPKETLEPSKSMISPERSSDPRKIFSPANYFTACGVKTGPHCAAGKLVLPPDLFEPYLALLLREIQMPLGLNTVRQSAWGYIEAFRFTKRPGEVVTVTANP
jgi:hypothetical protein